MHTFQTFNSLPEDYDCEVTEESLGDFVADTPVHKSSDSFDCNLYIDGTLALPDTCPQRSGSDPFFNFMNYLNADNCYEKRGEFTCGQIERMHTHFQLFREQVITCSNPAEMEIEVVILFDDNHLTDENRIYIEDENGGTIYDSLRDQHYVLFQVDGEIVIDHCLPRTKKYSVRITDESGNGFDAGGKVEIFVDRVLLGTATDGFQNSAVIDIDPAQLPTNAPTSQIVAQSTESPAPTPQPTSTWSPSVSQWPTTTTWSPTISQFPTTTPYPTSRPSVSSEPSSSIEPSMVPSFYPSNYPSSNPTETPSASPTASPRLPSSSPSLAPSALPTTSPSALPSSTPTSWPTFSPSTLPSDSPAASPTGSPTTNTSEREESSAVGRSSAFGGATLLAVVLCFCLLW